MNLLVNGCIGIISKTIVYPLDTIKIHKQTNILTSYKNIFNGYIINIPRVFLYNSIQLTLYRKLKQNNSVLSSILISTLIATIMSHPLDNVRVNMIYNDKLRYKDTININLYKGISMTLISQLPFTCANFYIYEHMKQKHSKYISAPISVLISSLMLYPLETIKRRSQLGIKLYNSSVIDLYRGIWLLLVKSVIQTSTKLLLFDR